MSVVYVIPAILLYLGVGLSAGRYVANMIQARRGKPNVRRRTLESSTHDDDTILMVFWFGYLSILIWPLLTIYIPFKLIKGLVKITNNIVLPANLK